MILYADVKFPNKYAISDECKDFITKLLIKDKNKRC